MTNQFNNKPPDQLPDPGPQDNSGGSNEWVSALADGQLRGRDFSRAVAQVSASGDARATWHAYHVVGDVLRAGELAACADDAAFLARFQARLQRDIAGALPTGDSSFSSNSIPDSSLNASSGKYSGKNSGENATTHEIIANYLSRTWENGGNGTHGTAEIDTRPRWKLLAGVASIAAVGAIAWSLVGGLSGLSGPSGPAGPVPAAAQLAQAPEQPQVMIRDPRLDAMLAAHKQFGGTSALQMPAGFLRNATFESPSR